MNNERLGQRILNYLRFDKGIPEPRYKDGRPYDFCSYLFNMPDKEFLEAISHNTDMFKEDNQK